MQVRTSGVRVFALHVRHFTDILHTAYRALGGDCAVAVLRLAAGAATLTTLAATARAMWALPAVADSVIACTAAIAWTRWLDQQRENQ